MYKYVAKINALSIKKKIGFEEIDFHGQFNN